jgi:hypothetical protein
LHSDAAVPNKDATDSSTDVGRRERDAKEFASRILPDVAMDEDGLLPPRAHQP